MSAVTIKGLEALQRRLAAAPLAEHAAQALRHEAETLAEAARETAPGRLGGTVEIRDQSRGERPAYAVGTAHPAGRYLEFGTRRRLAAPWLWPHFWSRSAALKNRLRRAVLAALKV